MEFRPYRDADKDQIIRLIDSIYAEYGDRVHLQGSEADLEEIPAHFRPDEFMVLDDNGRVFATVAVSPDADRTEVFWLKRLYLDARLRGTGEADRLLGWAVDGARRAGARRVELWSDVRFERAHAFYRKHGFIHDGDIRTMTDGWAPYREYFFYCEL